MTSLSFAASTQLGQLPAKARGTVATIDWAALSAGEARRLREFGLDEGVAIELLHPSTIGGGPLACRIGRMTIAMRRHVALAITVTPN